MKHALSQYQEQAADLIASADADRPPAMLTDKWIVSSALQKAIRRSEVETAQRAALGFYQLAGADIWRRFLIIASEDAAWYASGLDWDWRRPIVGRGDVAGLMQTYLDLGIPEPLVAATKLAMVRAREPITCVAPLVWLKAKRGDTTGVLDIEPPETQYVDGIPLYALDRHTRLGKRAIEQFAIECSEVRECLEANVSASKRKEAAYTAAFYIDGHPIRRRFAWRDSLALVGGASVETMALTAAVCQEAAWRKRQGEPERLILWLTRLLAESPKDRSTDYLICAARDHHSLATIRQLCADIPMADRLAMVSSPRYTLPERTVAFDNQFEMAVIFTKPTTALAKQTCKRVTKEFSEFIEADQAKVYDILELPERLTQFELNQKLIFIAKKQTNNLERLSEALLKTYPQLAKRKILLIDDEADNASIGYVNDKDLGIQLRTIASQLDELRRDLPQASFLQVTATPYSLYLQPEGSPLAGAELAPVRPHSTELVPVHPEYTGGQFYFEDSQIAGSVAAHVFKPVTDDELGILHGEDRRKFKVEECLTSDKVLGLRLALLSFITAACLRRIQDEQAQRRPKRFAFLFHTAASRASHAWQESVILHFDEKLQAEAQAASDLLRGLVQTAYDDLVSSIIAASQPVPAFSEVYGRVLQALTGGELMITKVNSEAQISALLDDDGQLRLRTPLNIFIGGQILDRGITIANLIGFYYGRNPQRFQQDTVLQHSRMYGFRPLDDQAVTRFYTSRRIHRAMQCMHEADTALRESIQASGGDQSVYFIELDAAGQIVPCSNQKILASNVTTLRPSRRILPVGFQTDYKTRLQSVTNNIDAILKASGPFPSDGEAPPPYAVSLDIACGLIDKLDATFGEFSPGYEDRWNASEYKAILEHLSHSSQDQSLRGQVLLMVRTGRNLSRLVKSTSHAEFADAPDTTRTEGTIARASAINIPVLMMIRQNGSEQQGWRDCPFWWPVIMTPARAHTTLFAHTR